MCGIAGIASWENVGGLGQDVHRMIQKLVHRGPDDQGIWADEENGVALGQRRLSIIDLSPEGHQPMVSRMGRWVVSFNGEIYNFRDLKKDLERGGNQEAWRGHSDTEVMLACVEAWGVERALRSAVGMFALALWDRQTRSLVLARDRLGEKPLYFGRIAGRLVFGSELKALKEAARGALQIDRGALAEYMRFGYVPAPLSIYSGVYKLKPGHFVQFRGLADVSQEPVPYWRLAPTSSSPLRPALASLADNELVDRVEQGLSEAVRLQMVSDVPLGAFLSGGVDSSTVVALMQTHSATPVRTFTIGFDHAGFDEAPHAARVAKHLCTDHTELYITADDAERLIPRLPEIYDEPFADSSQIPTILVSQLTRRHVTVSLSGDGGDELFAGYPRYALTDRLWRYASRMPLPVRNGIAGLLCGPSSARWDSLLGVLPSHLRREVNGRRLHRLGQLLRARSLGEMYVRLMSHWQLEEAVVRNTDVAASKMTEWDSACSPMDAMRLWDLRQYLPDDLMVKVDRASMYSSLEVRAPMLDFRVVELALGLPAHALIRDGKTKWVLREVLYRYVPEMLIERPKAGFSVPLGAWLRGPIKSWADDLLNPVRMRQQGFLDDQKVAQLWQEHTQGSADRSSYLWNVLMFQAWLAAERTR